MCHIVILLIVASSTHREANSWLVKYGISLVQDLLFNQFFKALIQAWLIKRIASGHINRRSVKKIMLRLIDKVVLRALLK